MPTATPTLSQLQRALALAEQIEQLETELRSVLSGSSAVFIDQSVPAESPKARKVGRRIFSAASKAKMAAAQKARWAAKRA